MLLNVYTIYDKIDGSASQLILARSDARVVRDFVGMVSARNKKITASGGSPVNLDDFSVRRVGYFDDVDCTLKPCPVVVVPFCASEDSESLS